MDKKGKTFSIGFYTFLQQIGHGGFSDVYLVNHRDFKTYFVAKAMRAENDDLGSKWETFEAEVKALSALSHPNIIRLYDHFKHKNKFYIFLEYCPNGSLHDESTSQGGMKLSRFHYIAREIVDALAYCHKRGVAHRDIKPANVLIDAYYRAKIADFGLCANTNPEELTENFGGSLSYLAPELFQKKPHNAMMADVWALGVTFATILMGRSPWYSDSLGGLKKLIASGKYHLSKRIPDVVQDLISKMIVIEPTERITMAEILNHPFFTQCELVPRGFASLNSPSALTAEKYIDKITKYLNQKEKIKNSEISDLTSMHSFILHSPTTYISIPQRIHAELSSDGQLTTSDDVISFK